MERITKPILNLLNSAFRAVLIMIGILGAIASADRATAPTANNAPLISMIHDVRLAQEVNDLNHNAWNHDVANINEDGLSRVETLLSQGEDFRGHSHE